MDKAVLLKHKTAFSFLCFILDRNKAVLYMVFSAMAFAAMNAFVKHLNSFHVYQIVFFRAIGTLFFTLPLLLRKKIPFFGNQKKPLILRGVFGVISLTCFFESLNYLPLGTSVSLRYTSPIFAAIFAFVFLKEKIKPIQWFLFLLAFGGVLIIKGFGLEVNSMGLILILISAIFLGLIFVVIRKIGNTEDSLVIINYFMLMAFIFGGIMTVNNWKNPTIQEWFILLSLGVFGYFGQLYMTKGFQLYKTSVVAPVKYLEVIFVILIGAFWFNETYNASTLLGIAMIFIGLIYNIYVSKPKK